MPKTKPISKPARYSRETDLSTLTHLLSAYRAIDNRIKDLTSSLEEQKEALKKEITPIAERLEIEKEVISGNRISRSSRSTIKPELLLERGVPMTTIQYATVETWFYKIEKVKE